MKINGNGDSNGNIKSNHRLDASTNANMHANAKSIGHSLEDIEDQLDVSSHHDHHQQQQQQYLHRQQNHMHLDLDLQSFDFTQHSVLQFKNPSTGAPFDEEEFNDYFEATYSATLSDGVSKAALIPNGNQVKVNFHDRSLYRQLHMRSRFQEGLLQMRAIRCGLHSIVPARALQLLSWSELELRVCGEPFLDLQVLQAHTVYRPNKFNAKSPIVVNFWRALSSFSASDRAKFLQFGWARSRLPALIEDESELTYRMQLSILHIDHDNQALPTSETCFFNVNLPHYSSYQVLREKLLFAITHCSSITS
jgi:other hect domain ubiquitin protein ligase E3